MTNGTAPEKQTKSLTLVQLGDENHQVMLRICHTLSANKLYNFNVTNTFISCYDLTSFWVSSCMCKGLRREVLWVNNILWLRR